MDLQTFTTSGLAINTYLLVDPESLQGVVIDPTRDVYPILEAAQKANVQIRYILETHVHADFASGSKELKDCLNNEPIICCSGMGGVEWIPQYADKIVKNGEMLQLGAIKLKCQHTPGHTPEHLIWLAQKDDLPPIAFTGDFLFVGSVGRPDLLGETALNDLTHKLYESIFIFLPTLPNSVIIYPAHGAGSLCGKGMGIQTTSTLEIERKTNPFLQALPENEWSKLLLDNLPRTPSYFKKMKQLNLVGPHLIKQLPELDEITQPQKDKFYVDIRNQQKFAQGHLSGAINVPFEGPFLTWAPEIISYDREIVLIGEDDLSIYKALSALQIVGLDNVVGYILADTLAEEYLTQFPMVSPQDLKNNLSKYHVIDVRTPSEWKSSHIENAVHIELSSLKEKIQEIPKDKPIATICGSGYRASIAASLLQQHGFKDVSNVQGGMKAWLNLT